MHGLARVRFWARAIVLLVPFFSLQAVAQDVTIPAEVAAAGFADLIVVNGKIMTMDDTTTNPTPGTIAQAMAIKSRKIIATGTNDRIRRFAGPKTEVLDVKGKTVIPGVIEPHGHLFSGALRWAEQLGVELPNTISRRIMAPDNLEATKVMIRNTLREMAAQAKPDDWLDLSIAGDHARRWSIERNIASMELLDQGAPNNPVHLAAGLRSLLNTKALNIANQSLPDFEKQLVVQMEHTGYGEKLGESEIGAKTRGWLGVPERWAMDWEVRMKNIPIEKKARMLAMESETWASYGVTSFSTRIPYPSAISGYAWLAKHDQMPIRLQMGYEIHRSVNSVTGHPRIYEFTGNLTGVGNDYFWIGGVSSERWDTRNFEQCVGPDLPDLSPELKKLQLCQTPDNYYYQALFNAAKYGWRLMQVHNVASHGSRLFNDMMKRAMKEGNLSEEYIRELRFTVDHCAALGNKPDIVADWKRFNMVLSCHPSFFRMSMGQLKAYGEKYLELITPFKTLINQGVRVIGGMGDGNPRDVGMFYWMHVFMTRTVDPSMDDQGIIPLEGIPVRVLLPQEKLDRVTVMKMWTNWAADYMMKPDLLGSLEPGKFADFVVLDRDYFTIPEDEIPQILPLMTVVGARTIYLHRDFAAELGRQSVGHQPPRGWPRFPNVEAYEEGKRTGAYDIF
ncbi:MAG: amidohydrolase family protein [Acidobacteria bacterium]|nr:amidohydrolase family protein [Acidobacteriota bacterium]